MTEAKDENTDESAMAIAPRRRMRVYSPAGSLVALARALQECAERLHLGPHGLLMAAVSVEGELRLLRPRAKDVMRNTAGLEAWQVLWRAFLADNSTSRRRAQSHGNNGVYQQLSDGQGRLLLTCASLLRQFLSPNAHYPVAGSPSSLRNRLRLVRVLREMTTPGEMLCVSTVGDDENEDGAEQRRGDDLIGRMTHASLRGLQPYVYGVAGYKVTRRVVEGCIHYIMCTHVEDDVLTTLRQLLVRFLWSSSLPKGEGDLHSIVARARDVLSDSTLYIVPCQGVSILHSRVLPFGTFLLPTVSPEISPHQGTVTPFFTLECHADRQAERVMLLRIDDQGGLLQFEHSNRKEKMDTDSDMDAGDCSSDGRRVVERQWTTAEQEKAQWEAARMLYEWAWMHGVTAILTPSHVPPVIKTYGLRYNVTGNGDKERGCRRPIFMVDEVDEIVFDALLRRLQYWRRDKLREQCGAQEDPVWCPAAAVLRRDVLELPGRAEDVFLPFSRLAYGPLLEVCSSATVKEFMLNECSNVRAVLLELDQGTLLEKSAGGLRRIQGVGSMLLVAPTAYQLRMYTDLLLKCLASVRAAMDASPSGGDTSPECGLGFVRAGGALPIALSRQLRLSAEALKCQMQRLEGTSHADDTHATANLPVVAAVLQMLSEVLLELPRRLADLVTAHHQPLRHAWLQLESDAIGRAKSHSANAISSLRDPPLHVCIRENVSFYRRTCTPPLCEVGPSDREQSYFCCSDTESSDSESDESDDACRRERLRGPPTLSFVEPIATTTGALRAAITLLRLTLMDDSGAIEAVGL
ncbi:hypothetical protein MOQ_002753 [Trypanosoma cruzi marinkellei]|uniref:Uncharacterized protein n=1 Tax=Trypanosoma cruzi marinkellei TaxID=85056 RepID=K2NEI6_TRYCR|nr:hypothetical protein MOQ_002753 [Trypanosoma cruzi marinkellei]